jgi:hypothetical protein
VVYVPNTKTGPVRAAQKTSPARVAKKGGKPVRVAAGTNAARKR